MKIKTCLFPGSFNPLHEGHIDVIERCIFKGYKHVFLAVSINANKPSHDLESAARQAESLISANGLSDHVKVVINKGSTVSMANELYVDCIIRSYRSKEDKKYEKSLIKEYKKQDKTIKVKLLKANKKLSSLSSTFIRNQEK